MADVFLSYASEDRERARQVADELGRHGWSVWWDRKIPLGQAFDAVIEKALTDAKCLIVLWSAHSIRSQWVRNEASAAEARGILLPAFIEDVEAPLAFRLLNGANLTDWQPGTGHPEFDELIDRVGELVPPAPGTPAATSTPAPPPLPIERDARRAGRPFPWRLAAIGFAMLGIAALLFVNAPGRASREDGGAQTSVADPVADPRSNEPARAADTGPARPAPIDASPADNTQPDAGAPAANAGGAGVGQVTMNWAGVNALGWKVLDLNRKVLRDTAVGADSSRSEDLMAGNYVVEVGYPEFPSMRVTIKAGESTVVAPPVGQITFTWNGSGAVGWKVLDANRKTIRDTATGRESTRSEDLLPGDYTLVVGHPEYPSVPITVKAGAATTYTPPVGRITLNWSGANVVGWKVVDANKKTIRDTASSGKSSRTEDVLPGSYMVVLGYPEFPPVPVSVKAGETVTVNR